MGRQGGGGGGIGGTTSVESTRVTVVPMVKKAAFWVQEEERESQLTPKQLFVVHDYFLSSCWSTGGRREYVSTWATQDRLSNQMKLEKSNKPIECNSKGVGSINEIPNDRTKNKSKFHQKQARPTGFSLYFHFKYVQKPHALFQGKKTALGNFTSGRREAGSSRRETFGRKVKALANELEPWKNHC